MNFVSRYESNYRTSRARSASKFLAYGYLRNQSATNNRIKCTKPRFQITVDINYVTFDVHNTYTNAVS